MYAQTTISDFYCDYCNKKFSVADYNNDIEATKEAVQQHEEECRNKIKICLGDVYIFNVDDLSYINDMKRLNCSCAYQCILDCNHCTFGKNYSITPPMKVVYVDITNPQMKILHVVLTKFNHILKVWEIDEKAMEYFKKKYGIEYFEMYESQINRQFSLSDFKDSFKIVKILSDWVNETSAHGKKQCETNIGYDWENNDILLTIKIPYKTKGRN